MIGKTVSHYRVAEKLGGGGMGSVALKFLPEPRAASGPTSPQHSGRQLVVRGSSPQGPAGASTSRKGLTTCRLSNLRPSCRSSV